MIGVLGLAVLSCAEPPRVEPSPVRPARVETGAPAPPLRVFTQNVYVGADLDAVLAALATPDSSDDLPALETAVRTLLATDAGARIRAIVAAIARTRPHVVGLQEMSVIDLDLTAQGRPVAAHLDFFAELDRALRERSLPYDIAARNRNFIVTPLPGVSLADEDVVLVDRCRTRVLEAFHGAFTAPVGSAAAGVELRRGWAGVRLRVGHLTYRVVTTHLESDRGDERLDRLRAAQISELVERLGPAGRTVIMGDLNDRPSSALDRVLRDAGYLDVWAALGRGEGPTCCHSADLGDEAARMTSRIDYIYARGFAGPASKLRGSVERLGLTPADRIPGPHHPIWPSDHAGLFAELAPGTRPPRVR